MTPNKTLSLSLKFITFLFVLLMMGGGESWGQTTQTWNGATSSTFLTSTNWGSGTPPGSTSSSSNNDIAYFNVNTNAGTNGINLNFTGYTYYLGAINLGTGATTSRTINNSSGSYAGTLSLNGVSLNSVSNTIIWNQSSGTHTFANGSSKNMGLALNNSTNNVIQITGTGGINISSIISGSNNLTLQGGGTGVLTLSAANTYTGSTSIGNSTTKGKLTLTSSGNIAKSSTILVGAGAGATFDVSAIGMDLTTNSQALSSAATGAAGNTTGTIVLASGKNIILSSAGLTFTALSSNSVSPITLSGSAGAIQMNSAPVTVPNNLAVGSYTLIAQQVSGANVTGTIGTLNYNGTGNSTTATISDASGSLILTVTASGPPPTITGTATATAFTTIYGTVSTAQTFAVSGSNLTANLVATAPTGFEVSSDGTTYGSTATYTQVSGSANGTLYVRLAATAAVSGSYNSKNIVLSSTGATSINITTASSGNSVTAKALTITGISISNKTYSGTNNATITGSPAFTGLVNGESYTPSGGTATFNSVNVANGIGVTISGYSAPSTNYSLTQPTGLTANITPASLTITANGVSKVYGTTITGAAGSTAFTSSGLVSSQTIGTVTITYGTGSLATASFGTYTSQVTPSAATGGTFTTANYNITYTSGTITVTAAPLTITGVVVNNKQYDGTTTATFSNTGSYSGLQNSETFTIAGTPSVSYTTATVGTNKATSVSGYTAPSSNYSISQPSGYTANITAITLTVTSPTASNKTYDGTTTATIGGTLVGVLSADIINVNLAGTFADANVGTGKTVTFNIAGSAIGNYTLSSTTALADISKANQSITFASTNTVLSNAADYAPGATSVTSGINPISYSSSDATVATIVSGNIHIVGVGNCTITASQVASQNYNATSAQQTLTVNQAPVITATPSALAAFTTTAGTVSTAQAYTVVGTTLSADISLAAITGFEYCTIINGTYTSTLTLTRTGTSVNATVYVRIAAASTVGSYSGNIALTSTNATSVNVAVSGTVNASGGTIANWTF